MTAARSPTERFQWQATGNQFLAAASGLTPQGRTIDG